MRRIDEVHPEMPWYGPRRLRRVLCPEFRGWGGGISARPCVAWGCALRRRSRARTGDTADLRGIPTWSVHGANLSRNGAHGNPGAIQRSTCTPRTRSPPPRRGSTAILPSTTPDGPTPASPIRFRTRPTSPQRDRSPQPLNPPADPVISTPQPVQKSGVTSVHIRIHIFLVR